MTYQEFITLVSREVLDRRAWPNDASKLQEQIDLAYVAGIAVAAEIPLSRFTLSEVALSPASVAGSSTNVYAMPVGMFDEREDLGINSVIIDGKRRDVSETMPIQSVYRAGENPIQSAEKHFSVDIPGRKVIANSASAVLIERFAKPTKPTTGNYTSTGYFIPTKDAQRVVHIVSSHVSGSRIRDNAGATFQSMLEQFYGRT